MTSNGMLINDEIINKMIETNMETISISLDGLKETHESFRKVPNSFDKIINNIKKLQQVPSIKIVQIGNIVWEILFTHLILMKEDLISV